MKNTISNSILMIILIFTLNASFAQVRATKAAAQFDAKVDLKSETKTNITKESCFCCGEFYSLPKPVISGPKEIICGTQAVFTSKPCEGAQSGWSVSPAIAGSTHNPTSFTVPANAPAGTYTLTYQVSCNKEKIVSTPVQFTIVSVPNCKPNFKLVLTQLPNGLFNISTDPDFKTPGQEHWWGIQYNGTYPNCNNASSPIPFTDFNSSSTGVWGGYINSSGILTPYKGTGITIVNGAGISYSGLPNNSCFKLTHYVKCCGQLYRQTAYFSVGTSNAKIANTNKATEINPQIIMSEVEIVK